MRKREPIPNLGCLVGLSAIMLFLLVGGLISGFAEICPRQYHQLKLDLEDPVLKPIIQKAYSDGKITDFEYFMIWRAKRKIEQKRKIEKSLREFEEAL